MRLFDGCARVWLIALVIVKAVVGVHEIISSESSDNRFGAEEALQRDLIENRIIGGTTASQGEFPFFVQWSGCGASLIAKNLILTAAHCSELPQFFNIVLVGAYKSAVDQGGAQYRKILKRHIHPKFNNVTMVYDYMVMELDSPVTGITPVKLNSDPNYPVDNQLLTVVGFGVTTPNGQEPNTLRKVDVNYINPTVCNSDYRGLLTPNVMLCAGVPSGGKDSCQGDSGGPILDANNVQVGIVSFGYGCAQAGFPGIYSRLSGGIDWINQQICTYSPSDCKKQPTGPPPTAPSPTTAPAASPTSNSASVSVQIDIMYDDFPEETTWKLATSTGKSIGLSSKGVGDPNTLQTTKISLSPGTYILQLSDGFGDGFCCSNGNGYYAIYALVNGNKIQLARGPGSFLSLVNVKFTVPSSSTPPPPPTRRPVVSPVASPTLRPVPAPSSAPVPCSDSTGPVIVNGVSRTCTWLSVRPSLWPSQCVSGKQAYGFCKKICKQC